MAALGAGQVVTLAGEMPELTDVELRARLLALAESDARCRPPGAARPGGLPRRWILAWRRARRAIGCGG